MQTTFGAYLVGLLAAGSQLAAALPPRMDVVQPRSPAPAGGQTLSVPVRHNTKRSKTVRHPALVYAKALNKYNATVPTHVQNVVNRFRLPTVAKRAGSEQGSVANAPEDSDSEYISTITVGTPGVALPMDFDTGSSDLWVMGPKITSAAKTYDPSDSSSAAVMDGASWTISYGDGSSSSGTVYKDKVTIGNLTVAEQAVEVATTVSEEFTEDSAMSGLVGLAMSSLNTVKPTAQKTWFDNVKASLSSEVFTANLNHEKDGTYDFGYIDDSLYSGTIYYADLITGSEYGGYWTIAASGYAVGNGTSTTSSSGSSSTGSGTSSSSGSSTTGGYGGGYGGGESGSGTGTGTTSSPGSGSSGGFGSYGGGDSGYGAGGSSTTESGYGSGYGSGTSSDSTSEESGSDGWLSGLLSGLESEADSSSSDSSSSSSSGADFLSSGFGFKKERKTTNTHTPTRTTPAKRSVTLDDTSITGIADTGTTLLMLPDAVVSAYYAQVSGATESQQEGGYVFSCDASLPDFTFGIGEGQITVPGEYINYMAVDSSGSQCYGGIQSDADIGMAIFGDVALKSAFVVFDSANSRVGWAAKASS